MKVRIIASALALGTALVSGIASGAVATPGSTGRAESASPRGTGFTAGFNLLDTFLLNADAGVRSITAGESINGRETWGVGMSNANTSAVLNGAQVAFDTTSTAVNMNNWGYSYFYPFGQGGFGVSQLPCPAPQTYSEVCPSPGATISNGGYMFVGGYPGLPATFTTGLDSSFVVGAAGANGDSSVTVSFALNDARYASPNDNQITVSTSTDNADESSPPVITSNGAAVPSCPQPAGTACTAPVEWASYQYSPPGGGSAVTCNDVSMQINHAPYNGTAIPYQFTFHEKETGTDGCPIGNPGVEVAVNSGANYVTMPCTSGTDCSATVPIARLGKLTATVGSGQGVLGFFYSVFTRYDVNFPASTAAPPQGASSTVTGSSSTPGGTATATNGGTTAEAQNGTGVVLVSQFNSAPLSSPPLGSNGNYFDVEVATGSTFTGVSVMDCNSSNNMNHAVDTLKWWNGTDWAEVTDANGSPVNYTGSPPCASVTLNATTSPSLSQLTGTVFAVAARAAQSALIVTTTSGTVGRGLALTSSGGSGSGALSYRVTNGTARGCTIRNSSLSSTSAGTCLVTATKAADGGYNAFTSAATRVTFAAAISANPSVTVHFVATNSSLSVSAQHTLTALANRLATGATVTIVGFAPSNGRLATIRARAVARFLATRVTLHVTVKTVMSTQANQVTVTTMKR